MIKNYIPVALLVAIFWNFEAEAVVGMSASKALSYSNTIKGTSSGGGNGNSGKALIVKETEKKSITYTLTMMNENPSVIESKQQTLKAGDNLKVFLPSSLWEVDSGNCRETHTITVAGISFKILGVRDSGSGPESSCEIRIYGSGSGMLNKVINLTVN